MSLTFIEIQRVLKITKPPCIRNRSQFSYKARDKTISYCSKTIGSTRKRGFLFAGTRCNFGGLRTVEGSSVWGRGTNCAAPKPDMVECYFSSLLFFQAKIAVSKGYLVSRIKTVDKDGLIVINLISN